MLFVVGVPDGYGDVQWFIKPWAGSIEEPEWWTWKSIWYYEYDECDESWRG